MYATKDENKSGELDNTTSTLPIFILFKINDFNRL